MRADTAFPVLGMGIYRVEGQGLSVLTVGSLFAGIGGFDLAAERAGLTVKWQVEIDPYAQRVLAKHWPGVKRYGDIRKCHAALGGTPRDWCHPLNECSGCLERVDVLCGGFPCQDISSAGAGAGIDGDRSGLWREYSRLVRELRPRYVIVENVSALLARGLGRVLGDLAACGYDAEWDCIPASAAGAPHRRDRVWIVAYPAKLQLRQKPSAGVHDARHTGAGTVPGRSEACTVLVERGAGGMADSNGSRLEGRQREVLRERAAERAARPGGASAALADTDSRGQQERAQLDGCPSQDSADWHPRRRHLNGCCCAAWWESEPDVGRVAHGVPARVDRLRGLGNAIVPQVAEWIFRRILEADAEATSLQVSNG